MNSPFWLCELQPAGLAGTGIRRTPAPPPRRFRRVGLRSGSHSSGRLEILRQRRLDLDAFPGEGMWERQPRGVQELALEAELPGPAVHGIARHRQVDRREVDADLVRAPGLELHVQERMSR